MYKPIVWRFALIGAVLIAALFAGLPPKEKINLGLDLQGGMHLVYEVQAEKAVEMTIERLAEDIRASLEREGVTPLDVSLDSSNRIRVELAQQSDVTATQRIIIDFSDLIDVPELSSGLILGYEITETRAEAIRANAIDQALETLRNRIDQFGVSEPTLQRQGERRILIQLPGIQDPERAKSLIKTTARLEFRMVNEKASIQGALDGDIPRGLELFYHYEKNPITGTLERKDPLLLEKKVLLGGESVADADVRIDQRFNEPYVLMIFDSDGARRFEEITSKNVKRRMAIVLDGKIHSAPVIQERIGGGRAQITGSFSAEEAHDLAIVLRAGALPAPLDLLEERTVGPSLGADSVSRGVKSIIWGFIFVVLFMLVYYRVGGIVAGVALTLNLILMAGAMGYLGATLTLPGIAGVILTVGMAVDANVLVFERVREEIANGKTIRAAIDSGFSKAFLTIIDANITTLIAAVVLFQFGTGPLKGFAVTLTIGILASLFTAIFVSRTFFNLILSNRKIKSLSI